MILGKIGIALNIGWCEPISSADVEACDRYQQFLVSNNENKMQILSFY